MTSRGGAEDSFSFDCICGDQVTVWLQTRWSREADGLHYDEPEVAELENCIECGRDPTREHIDRAKEQFTLTDATPTC